MRALAPGSTIGILGGGQLGRMLALAAAELGLRCHIYSDEAQSPAAEVAAAFTCADFDNADTLSEFAMSVDVVTTEFENVPAATAQTLSRLIAVHPNPEALAVAQDRLAEKDFVTGLGLATARYGGVSSADDVDAALATTGLPAILKTRRLGYDGKGQMRVWSAQEGRSAFESLGGADLILEERLSFAREISALVARSADGAIVAYDVPWNIHKNGILARSIVPCGLPETVTNAAVAAATRIAHALDYVGILAVEFFVQPDGRLLINEIAPRVHNSGHWTQDACRVSQFQQHIRAVAGWPLIEPRRHSDVVMDNLIGDDVGRWLTFAAEPDTSLHLYGKQEPRPGRKMGHVNRVYALGGRPSDDEAGALPG